MHESDDDIVRAAEEICRQDVTGFQFRQKVYGDGGLIQQRFPTAEQREAFFQSPTGQRLAQLFLGTHDRDHYVLTVRVRPDVYEQVTREACRAGRSINQFCVEKLRQPAAHEAEPAHA